MIFGKSKSSDKTPSGEPKEGPQASDTASDDLIEALVHSRGLLQDLLDTAADLAFEVDGNGRFTYVFPKIFAGEETLAWVGAKASSILWPDGASPSRNPIHAKRARDFDAVKVTLFTEDRFFDFCIRPVLDDAGAPTGAIRGSARDVTDGANQRRAQRLSALAQATEARLTEILLEAQDAGDLLDRAAQSLMDSFRAEGVQIVSFMGRDNVALANVGDPLPQMPSRRKIDIADKPMARINVEGRDLIVLPLRPSRGERGAALLHRDTQISPWSAEEESVLQSISSLLAVTYEKAQLIEQLTDLANVDGLTGMLNRRAFEDRVNRRLAQPILEPCALVFIDLDNFKEVNDTLGHQAGDDALKLVGQHLKKVIRPRDVAGRFGGDEFVLWLEGADREAAAAKGRSLIGYMPDIRVQLGKASLKLSASVGICPLEQTTPISLADLADRADAALYDVKRAGKSGIAFAEPEDADTMPKAG